MKTLKKLYPMVLVLLWAACDPLCQRPRDSGDERD